MLRACLRGLEGPDRTEAIMRCSTPPGSPSTMPSAKFPGPDPPAPGVRSRPALGSRRVGGPTRPGTGGLPAQLGAITARSQPTAP